MIGIIINLVLVYYYLETKNNINKISLISRDNNFSYSNLNGNDKFDVRFLLRLNKHSFYRKEWFYPLLGILWFFGPTSYEYFYLNPGDVDGITIENGEYFFYEIECDTDFDRYGSSSDCLKNTFGPPLTNAQIERFKSKNQERLIFSNLFLNPGGKLPEPFPWIIFLSPLFLIGLISSNLIFLSNSKLIEKINYIPVKKNNEKLKVYINILHHRLFSMPINEILGLPILEKTQLYRLLTSYYQKHYTEFNFLDPNPEVQKPNNLSDVLDSKN